LSASSAAAWVRLVIVNLVRPLGRVKPSALLVRGEDRYGHFLPEKRLAVPMSVEAQAAHAEAVRLFRLRQDQGFTKAAE